MRSAGFSAIELSDRWDLFVNMVCLVIRFLSNQTSQNRAQDSPTSGQAPVHSEWCREMAEWFIWLPLISSREEPRPTKVNYLQDGKLITVRLVTDPTSQRYWSVLLNTDLHCLVLRNLLIFSSSSYININASQPGTYATLSIILNRGLYI